MCEFCTEHGEGKKWYLEMKNYQEELLHAPIDRLQQRLGRVETRLEWNQRMFDQFVMPAATGEPPTLDFITGAPVGAEEGKQRAAGPQPAEGTVVRLSLIHI